MSDDSRHYLEQASQKWRDGKPREAGRLIFEKLPQEVQPKWATNILELVVNRTGVKAAPIERILYIGKHPAEWHKAHKAFSSARKLGIELEDAGIQSTDTKLLLYHLGLAEVVAKV